MSKLNLYREKKFGPVTLVKQESLVWLKILGKEVFFKLGSHLCVFGFTVKR